MGKSRIRKWRNAGLSEEEIERLRKKKCDRVDRVIHPSANKNTFLTWVKQYGNDLYIMGSGCDMILSFSGSDGPKITTETISDGNLRAHFDSPKEIEDFLIAENVYEKMMVMCGSVSYDPPTKHYLEWFNETYDENTIKFEHRG